ncbi:MAG: M48 family metallopeptidase [Synergistes sp.]|nr:M48 family metallopeptidase [Synergistes sp.]
MTRVVSFIVLWIALIFMPVCAEAALSAETAEKVWLEVAEPTELKDLPFSVKSEDQPNAWVSNNESVTVTTGLLKILDTEDELYAVFAHEAGHIKLNHINKSTSRNSGLSLISVILGSIFRESKLVGTAVNVGANLVSSGWSREQEIEADDYSVELASRHGRNPVGMYSAIDKMSKINKTEPSGFNSHPPDDRRMKHIKDKILSIDPNAKFPE